MAPWVVGNYLVAAKQKQLPLIDFVVVDMSYPPHKKL